jgi:hypothetical protein
MTYVLKHIETSPTHWKKKRGKKGSKGRGGGKEKGGKKESKSVGEHSRRTNAFCFPFFPPFFFSRMWPRKHISSLCMYVCMYVYMYVRMYVCMCVYVYICIHIYTGGVFIKLLHNFFCYIYTGGVANTSPRC